MDSREWIRAHVDALAISAYCSARERGSRTPRREPLLAVNPEVAYLYAFKVVRGRFRGAEAAIARSAEWSVRYARFVLKARFPRAEKAISRNPEWAYEYSVKVVGGRLPSRMHRAMESMRGDPFADKYLASQVELSGGQG